MTDKNYLYAVRATAAGKLVADIANPGHKFWKQKKSCLKAMGDHNNKSDIV